MSSRVAASPGFPGDVPIRTSNDPDGNALIAHTLALEGQNGSPAAPVGPGNPVPVVGISGPLRDASTNTVGMVSAQVLPAGTRALIEIQNTGATVVGINFGPAASLLWGSYVLQPGSGSLRFAAPGFVPTDTVNAVSSGAGGAITLKWA